MEFKKIQMSIRIVELKMFGGNFRIIIK